MNLKKAVLMYALMRI